MTEVVMFKAFDGTLFDTREKCLAYENEMKPIRMFNRDGKPASNVSCAYLVYLEEGDGERFINACCDAGEIYEGITKEDTGWFFWDEWEEQYRWLENDLINALLKNADFMKTVGA